MLAELQTSLSYVSLVDDDDEMRASLTWMLENHGVRVRSYKTPDELLDTYDPNEPGCLVLDLRLPGMSGLELCDVLWDRGCRKPFIMISGHGDIATAVKSMHKGAVDFLEKPFEGSDFLACVDRALARETADRELREQNAETDALLATLTPREREVLDLVITGMLTKQIAERLGVAAKTIDVHRSNITRKMRVESVAQLVRKMTLRTLGQGEGEADQASS